MNKDEVKALVDSQAQALKDAVDSIPSGDQQAEIDDLKAQLEEKKSELEAKDVVIADLQAKLGSDESVLAQVDAKAKELDALIPDAPQA